MKDKGMAHIGIGNAKGDDKAIEAVKLAVASPLLETTINGASHVIINISGDISLMDANDAASYVQDLAGDNANIIFGAKYDESMTDEATITVIATGLENAAAPKSKIMPDLRYEIQQTLQDRLEHLASTDRRQILAQVYRHIRRHRRLHHHFLVFRDRVSLRAQYSQWILKFRISLKIQENNI